MNSIRAEMLKSEKGFTLIELIMTSAIIAVLSTIAMREAAVYTEKSREAARAQMLREVQMAYEGGSAQKSAGTSASYWAWSDADGNVHGGGWDPQNPAASYDPEDFLPGLSVGKDMRLLWSNYDSSCQNSAWACAVFSAEVYHCDGKFSRMHQIMNNGWQLTVEWPWVGGCG